MKKLVSFLLAAVLAGTMLAACANNGSEQNQQPTPTPAPSDQAAFEGQIKEILDQLISQTIDKKTLANEELKDITCYDKPVDADSCQDILGLTPAEFASDVVSATESKPEGSWFAHSIVLIECQDGVDVAALADKIAKGTNPGRFGCIKAEAIVVGYAGQYILLCASFQNTCDALYTTFSDLSALPPVRIDRENDWSGGGMLGKGF
ncbi:MAG: hypothetical protein SCM11_05515 [Bacillota bacterium]|nr:hypothetical protein [Bacillota bacterium]